jgi:hypothetical protein
MSFNKGKLFSVALLTLMSGLCAYLYYLYSQSSSRIKDMDEQLKVLREEEKKASIVKSISTQMEEIAYQQKDISDEQRVEAEMQTALANEMRQRSEEERQNAIAAEKNALVAERVAKEASARADNERKNAESRRIQAEYSKSVADTLSYVALSRSLGSLSSTQWLAGNRDVARLLAYASYSFSDRYKADIYNPAIFRALSLSCGASAKRANVKGTITKIAVDNSSRKRFMTVSSYGDANVWNIGASGNLTNDLIVRNSAFDFRDICIGSEGSFLAASRNGQVLIVDKDDTHRLVNTSVRKIKRIFSVGSSNVLFVTDNSVVEYSLNENKVLWAENFSAAVTAAGKRRGKFLIFCKGKSVYELDSTRKLKKTNLPFNGEVTAFDNSFKLNIDVYGTVNGDIYLVGKDGSVKHLLGHRSRISQIDFDGQLVYTSSYDGTVNIWNTSAEKIEPMNVASGNKWICAFSIGIDKGNLWTGDNGGDLVETVISPTTMARMVKSALTRDFTADEWNQYIGESVPYEKYANK